MRQYGNALAAMSNEAVEYVRDIHVAKTFGQSVFYFKKFKGTIDEYGKWVIAYTKEMRLPMMCCTAAINGVFAFLIAGAGSLQGAAASQRLQALFHAFLTLTAAEMCVTLPRTSL